MIDSPATPIASANRVDNPDFRPWPALWSLVLGFFMIIIDTTIVSVANPTIMRKLDTDLTATLWATSTYLLAYAVPLLITGRLGDRYGQRRIYLAGLALFASASLVCGLSPNIQTLIVARVFQGLGAAIMSPQTMAIITRIFAPRARGQAMAVWGITAGVGALVGPIMGGVLIDTLGWEWIFFINVPVAIAGFVLALRYVPRLSTHRTSFDWLGMLLSAAGMFVLVFAIQEGERFNWGRVWGNLQVWHLLVCAGVILLLFVLWQRRRQEQALMPLSIFRDRNFSVSAVAILTVGFAVTSLGMPLMFYMQLVLGLTPTQSALLLSPMAIIAAILARPVGQFIDRADPRRVATLGLSLVAIALVMAAGLMRPEISPWLLLAPSTVLGVANSFMWGPLSALATFNLSRDSAGAGSGVYNASRQVGSVLGAAAITAFMATNLAAHFPGSAGRQLAAAAGHLQPGARVGYAAAMAQSMLLPAAVIALGAVVTLCFAARPKNDD